MKSYLSVKFKCSRHTYQTILWEEHEQSFHYRPNSTSTQIIKITYNWAELNQRLNLFYPHLTTQKCPMCPDFIEDTDNFLLCPHWNPLDLAYQIVTNLTLDGTPSFLLKWIMIQLLKYNIDHP